MSDLGELLRRARAYKGVTLRDAERSTRISRNYLAALEAHDFDQLPPRTYSRGIIRNYAQYLGLDPAVVLNLYEQAAEEAEDEEDFEVVPAVQPIEIRGHWAPNFAIIAFMLVISAVAFTWVYSAYLQPSDEALPQTISHPTATEVEDSLLELVASTPTATAAEDGVAEGSEGEGDAAAPEDTVEATSDSGTESSEEGLELDPTPTEVPTEGDGAAEGESGDGGSDGDGSGSDLPEGLPEGIAIPEGYHAFVIYAEEEVWVEVTLDGGNVVFDGILPAGGRTDYFIGQTATITSGNAAFVRVFVDGEDWGTLGEPWDAVVTYP